MNTRFAFLAALASIVCQFAILESVPEIAGVGDDETERIVGGESAKEGQFPWAVSLYYNGNFSCCASIIGNTTLLTAAHCVRDQFGVMLAESFHAIANVSRSSPSIRLTIAGIFPHPNSSSIPIYSLDNDIAIMRTNEIIPFGYDVQPICIARKDTPMNAYRNATVMGWGYTSRTKLQSNVILQYAEQTIVDNNECRYRGALAVKDDKICAKGDFKGVCNGDSGGPLVHLNRYSVPVQIGVTSYSNVLNCASSQPDVWMRVSSFYDFIVANTDGDTICTV